MNSYRLLLSFSIFTPGLVWTVFDARAQTCTQAPSCSELGYTKSASDCTGKTILYCPFDKTKAYCMDEVSCASLGFTDTVAECPGEYVKCPADSTKGKCNFEASPGDLKYSLRTSDHNGWLLCNGRSYDNTKYPELYSAISGSFGTKLPNYSGYFLKAAATASASNLKTAEQAGLPNIYASWKSAFEDQNTGGQTCSGALSCTQYDSGIAMEIPKTASSGYISRSFSASSSNSIYGRSTTVTPQNYSANVFIYAGRIKQTDTVDCKIGTYLYNDGTCKTTYDSSKTLLGVVTQSESSAVMYTFGGNTTASSFKAAETACKNKGGNSVASGYYIRQMASLGSKVTSNSVVVPINTSRKYWVFGDNLWTCSGSTCDGTGSSGSGGYYYCNQWY